MLLQQTVFILSLDKHLFQKANLDMQVTRVGVVLLKLKMMSSYIYLLKLGQKKVDLVVHLFIMDMLIGLLALMLMKMTNIICQYINQYLLTIFLIFHLLHKDYLMKIAMNILFIMTYMILHLYIFYY